MLHTNTNTRIYKRHAISVDTSGLPQGRINYMAEAAYAAVPALLGAPCFLFSRFFLGGQLECTGAQTA